MAIATAALFACATSSLARAQTPAADSWQLSDSWRFGATIYGYLPTISAKTQLPSGTTTDSSIDIGKTLSHLKMGFMGAAEAQKGRWGAFTDILYMDVGAAAAKTHEFHLGSVPIPADVTASTTLDLKATIWTLAGSYRVVADPRVTFDVLGGARLLDLRVGQDYQLTGNIGPIAVADRSGSSNSSVKDWNAIIGAKGRFALSDDRTWYLPYYVDVGTGDSKLTWQILGGVGYAFSWGDVSAVWRYLDFEGKSGSAIQNLNMNGPQVSVAFRW